jgi:hypothetical protein
VAGTSTEGLGVPTDMAATLGGVVESTTDEGTKPLGATYPNGPGCWKPAGVWLCCDVVGGIPPTNGSVWGTVVEYGGEVLPYWQPSLLVSDGLRATHLAAIQRQSTDTVRTIVWLVPDSRRGELLYVPLSRGAVVIWGVGWAGHE